MTSVQTPPLSRSGSSPSNVGLANRSGPSATPPASLSLRSSHNQLLGRDVIKESMESGSSATLPRSRQRYTMTSVRSAMGISDNLASSKNQAGTRGRGLPTKSSSSSALYSSSSNPKLAKNGANMQRRAESQQQELSRANTEGKIHNDLINNPTSDSVGLEKDNSQLPPFRRRTKSFLECHEKGWDLDLSWGNKEEKEEKKQQPSPEKEKASPAKERESQKEEKPISKQTCQEEKEEVEPVVEEEEEEEDDPTPAPRQPLLPVVLEAPISPTSSSSTNSPEWLPDNQHPLQSHAPAQIREELCVQLQHGPRSPAKPPRSSQPRVIKVELHPNNENQFLQQYPPSSPKQARVAERNTPTRSRAPPILTDPEPKSGLPKVGLRMDLTPETPSEDEDSSWTTLSQETPSPQTPRETADVWSEGDLPPGWREISDSSEIYFWHIPTGTTQYHRPVASADQHTSPDNEPGTEHEPQRETPDALKPPHERPCSLISDSSVELVPSPTGSSPSPSPSPSSSSTILDDVTFAGPNINTTACTANELKDYPVYPDPSLKAFEGATLRYASLKLNAAAQLETVDLNNSFSNPEAMSFPVRSLGWVEMAEQDLCEGRSSLAVHHCIRQLSYCRRDIRDSAGVWGEGKGMLLELQDRMLTLVDPDDRSLLHSQPISSIRVWGVGRDHDSAHSASLLCHWLRFASSSFSPSLFGPSLHFNGVGAFPYFSFSETREGQR
ncbi:Amyloid beta A4 precursor protein-binding family B member 2 [Liparis tanakae]|uniref:Amyloid beta A4 protein-binding family B member 2 n=1 Tax=Liparis tanakae TaxID=230148 RepID=A0A4Z2HXF5_9TELE|nr:Amyloid beta A4 precursor protein-binding family B member 2 [Liparis tanakae]